MINNAPNTGSGRNHTPRRTVRMISSHTPASPAGPRRHRRGVSSTGKPSATTMQTVQGGERLPVTGLGEGLAAAGLAEVPGAAAPGSCAPTRRRPAKVVSRSPRRTFSPDSLYHLTVTDLAGPAPTSEAPPIMEGPCCERICYQRCLYQKLRFGRVRSERW